MIPTTKEHGSNAQGAILALRAAAWQGDDVALDELWRIGMLAADCLYNMTMHETTGKRTRKLARKKIKWPFMLSAVAEIRNAKNNAGNPEAYAEWINLGMDTGIKLKNPGKGGTRSFKPGSPTGLAYRARMQIEEDLRRYNKKSDSEILDSGYHTWKFTLGAPKEPKELKINQKNLLKYVKSIRSINDLSDENQWMKAAELWLSVAYENRPDDTSYVSWPKSVYDRARKEGRSVREVLLTRLLEGFAAMISPPSAKKPIG
jgi:hypothetical protein